jgi:hypothetical protein
MHKMLLNFCELLFATLFLAAVDPRAQSSDRDYIGPEFTMIGKPAVQPTLEKAWDVPSQQKLWEESVRIVGVDFLTV